MFTVYKYTIDSSTSYNMEYPLPVNIPKGSKFLTLKARPRSTSYASVNEIRPPIIDLWYLVDTEQEIEAVSYAIYTTGAEIPEYPDLGMNEYKRLYLGTADDNGYIMHVFGTKESDIREF